MRCDEILFYFIFDDGVLLTCSNLQGHKQFFCYCIFYNGTIAIIGQKRMLWVYKFMINKLIIIIIMRLNIYFTYTTLREF
jgi:hypothetical protein